MATLTDRISVPPNVLFNEVSGEAVLLNQATGRYFTLDDVGTRVWKLIVQHGQLDRVYRDLLEEYDVDPQQLERDLLSLTDQLAANALLQIAAP
jgi:hypothetical protein